MKYTKEQLSALFDKYIKKLRIMPNWDISLEFVEDKTWRKTGDFKIDCDDKKAKTVEEMAKCFLFEFGDNKELSYGRCKTMKSFNDLYDGLNNIE